MRAIVAISLAGKEKGSAELFERIKTIPEVEHAYLMYGEGPQVVMVVDAESGRLKLLVYGLSGEYAGSTFVVSPLVHEGEYSRDSAVPTT